MPFLQGWLILAGLPHRRRHHLVFRHVPCLSCEHGKQTVSYINFPISGLCKVSFSPCQQSVFSNSLKFQLIYFHPYIYGSHYLSWCFAARFLICISYLLCGDPIFPGLSCSLVALQPQLSDSSEYVIILSVSQHLVIVSIIVMFFSRFLGRKRIKGYCFCI